MAFFDEISNVHEEKARYVSAHLVSGSNSMHITFRRIN